MNALHERELRDRDLRDRERDDYREQRPLYRDTAPGDREISLGTGTILGIFFALALTCAVFFGFGYSMGRKAAPPTTVSSEPATSKGFFSSFKPSAVSPLGLNPQQKNDGAKDLAPSDPPADAEQVISPANGLTAAQQVDGASRTLDAKPVPVLVKAHGQEPAATVRPTEPAPAMPVTNPNGTTMVQVAAVSHQEDADLLLSALKKRGYKVFIRHEAQDRLLHVQVGPFAGRKDADIMRQRLLADGYNAIVK